MQAPPRPFAIVTIFSGKKIEQRIEPARIGNQEVKQWILDVNLQDESYGIYSNTGKIFLRTTFQTAENDARLAKKDALFFAMTNPLAKVDKPWRRYLLTVSDIEFRLESLLRMVAS